MMRLTLKIIFICFTAWTLFMPVFASSLFKKSIEQFLEMEHQVDSKVEKKIVKNLTQSSPLDSSENNDHTCEDEPEIPLEVEENQLSFECIKTKYFQLLVLNENEIVFHLSYLHRSSYLNEIYVPPLVA